MGTWLAGPLLESYHHPSDHVQHVLFFNSSLAEVVSSPLWYHRRGIINNIVIPETPWMFCSDFCKHVVLVLACIYLHLPTCSFSTMVCLNKQKQSEGLLECYHVTTIPRFCYCRSHEYWGHPPCHWYSGLFQFQYVCLARWSDLIL